LAESHPHERAHTHRAADGQGSYARSRRALRLALGASAAYMVAEAVGGLLANSLALLADAVHMFSDVAALGLGLFATWIARRPATSRRTYGYYRAEILGALAQGALLVAVAISIGLEAIERIRAPHAVLGGAVIAVAAGGLAVNLLTFLILRGARDESLTVRGASLHVLSDALGSVGALAAGVLVWAFGWHWTDPVASLAIAALVIYASFSLLRDAVSVLLEGAPRHIDVDAVRDAVLAVPGALAVHDLHIWTIASGMVCLSTHVVAKDGPAGHAVLAEINHVLEQRFGIAHTTIQLEPEDFAEAGRCD
jgi:cobalt-zinc-cadmium efflux system protein